MKKKWILLFVMLGLLCLAVTVLAEGERSLLGVHWSYTPMFDFAEDAPGILWSEELGVVISVQEHPKEGLTLDDAVANWQEVNQDITLRQTIFWIHNGMKAIVLNASHQENGYELMVYFIETPISVTEIAVVGRENFHEIQEDLKKLIKTFVWQEKLLSEGLPYRMDLPEGWELARIVGTADYFTPDGKDPLGGGVEYLYVYYLKEQATDPDLQKRLDHPGMPDYNQFTVIDKEEIGDGDWPMRIWHLSIPMEDPAITVSIMVGRIATDRFIYGFEAVETETMTKEIFRGMLRSWQFVGNDSIQYFRQ